MTRSAALAALAACLAATAAPAREDPDAPARGAELRYCRTHVGQVAPPGARVADVEAFCACYADGAAKARLWELEQAEANLGEEVRQAVDARTRRLHAEKSAAVARACLGP